MKRGALLLPGRGSYTKATLNSLPPQHPWIESAEALRDGLPSLRELDAGPWDGDTHLRPDNAAPLIYLVSMIDAERARETHEMVCAGGNSLGWYTALAAAGALSFEDGFRLVQEIARLQMEHGGGGQILYRIVDDDWRVDPRQVQRVNEALASGGGEAYPSIALGGVAVLAGTEKGVAHLLDALPAVENYPFRLKQHGPYHTPLLDRVAVRARERLADLAWRSPDTTLIDGRGERYTPWSCDPDALAAYTLGAQITAPFGFTTTARVALREYAPDTLVLPGPGNTLGSICGHVLVMEGYRGIHARADFERVQESDSPAVWSMRR